MAYQNLSAEINPADLLEIRSALATIRGKMPFLITLNDQERQQQRKTGPRARGFLENCLTGAQNNPNILPPDFSVNEFGRDVRLWVALDECGTAFRQLLSDVEDTKMAAGSEALGMANHFYALVKAGARRSTGLKPLLDDLGSRFARGSRKPVPPPTPPTPPTPTASKTTKPPVTPEEPTQNP